MNKTDSVWHYVKVFLFYIVVILIEIIPIHFRQILKMGITIIMFFLLMKFNNI